MYRRYFFYIFVKEDFSARIEEPYLFKWKVEAVNIRKWLRICSADYNTVRCHGLEKKLFGFKIVWLTLIPILRRPKKSHTNFKNLFDFFKLLLTIFANTKGRIRIRVINLDSGLQHCYNQCFGSGSASLRIRIKEVKKTEGEVMTELRRGGPQL